MSVQEWKLGRRRYGENEMAGSVTLRMRSDGDDDGGGVMVMMVVVVVIMVVVVVE